MDGLGEQLAELLTSYGNVKLAMLFGSQAIGTANADSDIDLALLADAQLSAEFKLDLTERIGARFGRPVDIVDLFSTPEPVLGQALKGKRLLGSSTEFANLLTKHLLNTADFVPLQQRILAERRKAWINR